MLYGGDYNPEQWPEETWREDMRLMREAGVNLVSIGIFAWAKLQPREKTCSFGWLDRLMDLLAENGIYANLATATASPPPWMSKYPGLNAVDGKGHVWAHGSRQHYSPFSTVYRRFAAALVRKLATRYRSHPALALWHINNEYACHVQECHSEAATAAFRIWLKARYGSIEGLNDAWGTAFWSQHYQDWDEVLTPRHTPTFPNPCQVLDYHRFMSDAILDLCKMERDILRAITPDIPVNTNFMGCFKPLDYWKWAREIDFTSWDAYPDPLTERPELFDACGHDLLRSLKPGRPFVLMEQCSSHVNWRPVNAAKPPGVMRLWSLQSVARGADGVLFFQWRQSLAGAEKFHGAMVQNGSQPGQGRVFREVCELGADLGKLAPVVGSVIRSKVAIMIDWQSWWALESPSKPAQFHYEKAFSQIQRLCFDRNIAVDFVHPGSDLSGYSLVFAPNLYLLEKQSADNLDAFVRNGGTLLVTCFSGIVDREERIVPGGYPAYLRETLGIAVEEWWPLGPEQRMPVRFGRRSLHARDWRETIHLRGAKALATFAGDHLAGSPAVTRNRRGAGQAYYLGMQMDDPDLAHLLDPIFSRLKLAAPVRAPAGVEVTLRENSRAKFLFLLNHKETAARIPLGAHQGTDLLTGAKARAAITLEPHGAAVIALAIT
jgi:beta-galactosidase